MSQISGPEGHPDLLVVDSDTHFSEPWDLWTSRGPASMKDRLPQVRDVDGALSWVVDDLVLGPAAANCVVDAQGEKHLGAEWCFERLIHEVSPAASQVKPRLEMMDSHGVWAHLMYPNAVGFGGHQLGNVGDMVLRNLCVQIYNDAMAEFQEQSGDRLFPMAVIPWWDITASVREIHRVKELGLCGVNTTADPQEAGFPDLSEDHWSPVWETLEETGLPLNFHIGASATQSNFFGTAPWPSRTNDEKLAIGSAVLYQSNARVIANMIYGGIPERHPDLKIVSVESGIGWLPFFLQALDYQLGETAPGLRKQLSLLPSEYFRRQFAACFWFERDLLVPAIEYVGIDNCLFETDFPHPTCLYPAPLEGTLAALKDVPENFRRKVMGGNAARIYNLPVPTDASLMVDLAPSGTRAGTRIT